jgi:formate dehydrogenase/bidirectional [NiFe] hydrogenase diaphorase subunit
MIIPALYARQKQRGYLTNDDMRSIAHELDTPLYRINSVVTFFPHFRTDPPPKVELHVCRDMSCHLNGGVEITKRVQDWATATYGDQVEVCGASCLGRCDRPPAAIINEQLLVHSTEQGLRDAVTAVMEDRPLNADSDWELAKEKVGLWDLDVDDGVGKYDIVRRYVQEDAFLSADFAFSTSDAKSDSVPNALTRPERVLATLQYAGLLGMGGAGGRAYLKWGDVMRAVGTTDEKFVVCNADESEPGTFKDREILLAAPHLTIEGMILAALVTGATRGWIYIRHEYPEQVKRCKEEISRAEQMGACGKNIFGSGKSFELDVFVSPGGYICGEQTALIEAMQDNRAEPRNRPPELMTNGLWDQPTLLSNVETFAWVPAILKDGGKWFAGRGIKEGRFTAGSSDAMKGKRLFSISGDVAKPGVYEVDTGTTLGQLIDEHCDGMRNGKSISAVAMSGPSGGVLPPMIPVKFLNQRFVKDNVPDGVTSVDIRDLPLDINVSRSVGYMLGAGIVVYGDGCDVLAEVVANSRFYRNESCGKCVPCRIGSQKITEMSERLLAGQVSDQEFQSMEPTALELSSVMTATSICGLGQVASTPFQTFLQYFPELARKACNNPNQGDLNHE